MDYLALRKYRDLIEQGLSPSEAKAHVEREFDVTLTETWTELAMRDVQPGETW